jgi:hypothetical protein
MIATGLAGTGEELHEQTQNTDIMKHGRRKQRENNIIPPLYDIKKWEKLN